MEKCETIEQLRKQFKGVTSGCAGDTIFGAKALMFMAEIMNRIKPPRRKQKPTKWNNFVAAGNRAGKPMKQIAAEWRERKVQSSIHKQTEGRVGTHPIGSIS